MSVLIEENKAVVMRLHEEFFNNHNVEVLDDILAPSYVNHSANIHGRERMKELYIDLLEEHPTMYVNADDIIAEGDKVAVRWTWFNRDNPIVTGITIHRVREGRIVEDWYTTRRLEE
jgi:predicted SnoaL-like aldol condensation-catalyzing enzyme